MAIKTGERPLSEVLKEKKLDLLGHVLRRDFRHPLPQVTSDTAVDMEYSRPLAIKDISSTRRGGRPRPHWTYNNMSAAWDYIRAHDEEVPGHLKELSFDNQNAEVNRWIGKSAKQYDQPFGGSKRRRKRVCGA